MKIEEKARLLRDENERRAREAEQEMIRPALSSAERLEFAERAKVHWQLSRSWADLMLAPGKVRAAREARGRDAVNADRADRATDRLDEVRAVYRPGDSAEQVRRKIMARSGENYPLRTIQRDMKKIRPGWK